MKTKVFTLAALLCCASAMYAQESGYKFTTVASQKATPVKNQASTGTCWCFATTSFMESELLRMGKGEYDLSEMFIVRQKYLNQLEDNYYRGGNGNLGQGSLSHTWKNAFNQVGIVPEEVYHGINYNSEKHNHGEMVRYINALGNTAVKMKRRSPEYYKLINNLFDTYLGELPEKFTYKGKEYTPKSFAESLGLNMDDYIELTSFTHKPYYQKFSPEVPDNWENEQMYPDISYFPILARFFNVSIDCLFGFTNDLSEQEYEDNLNECVELFKTGNYEKGLEKIKYLTYLFPTNDRLRVNLTSAVIPYLALAENQNLRREIALNLVELCQVCVDKELQVQKVYVFL